VDFRRKKLNWVGRICSVEYDPNRNARLALVSYKDGEKGYILAPKSIQLGTLVVSGFCVPVENGNALALWNIPRGTEVHNIEFSPGSGGRMARSSGTSACLITRSFGLVTLRLSSGEFRSVPQTCWATVGVVGNMEARTKKMGKAGRVRWLGWRPTVRGGAINPVDHPHGGGEGRCPVGRTYPVTSWGKPRLGVHTRRSKKYSDIFLLR
jgi:large subunit ribosomal protein L2